MDIWQWEVCRYNQKLKHKENYRKIESNGVGGKEPESSGDIYVFRCSLLQAYNYFFPFGKEAEILEPQRLRDRFIKGYNNGATKYQ